MHEPVNSIALRETCQGTAACARARRRCSSRVPRQAAAGRPWRLPTAPPSPTLEILNSPCYSYTGQGNAESESSAHTHRHATMCLGFALRLSLCFMPDCVKASQDKC
eukprot:6191339-Pleurochrysis_carterae.AAC.1